MSEMIEQVAKAIALRNGDKFETIAADKPDWTANRGQFGGRFRDVNEPTKSDYLDMAEAAIEAMREPTMRMIAMGSEEMPPFQHDGFENAGMFPRDVWRAMIDTALTSEGIS